MVLLLLTLFFSLVFVIATVSAATGNTGSHNGRSGAIVGAGVVLLVTVALAWLTWRVEHRARNNGPGYGPGGSASGWSPQYPPSYNPPYSPPSSLSSAAPRYRPARHTPHSRRLSWIWMAVLAAIFGVVTGVGFSGWSQSNDTQHHGIAAIGTVTNVVKVHHTTRSGGYSTYNLDVHLSPAVQGRSTTTVHTPDGHPPASDGQQISVLLDPHNPGYAELPGQPVHDLSLAIAGIVLLSIIVAIAGWRLVRGLIRRRATRAYA